MQPVAMALLLIVAFGVFGYSAWRRWRLMIVGGPAERFDRLGERLRLTWKYALKQLRVRRYPAAGLAHMLVFFGFLVLLLRSLILWGRGFAPDFCFWLFGPQQVLGKLYGLAKDVFVVLVFVGVVIFFYYRVIKRLKRLSLNFDGLIVLVIIAVMMVADVLYDGASFVRHAREQAGEAAQPTLVFHGWEPVGSMMQYAVADLSDRAVVFCQHLGFWTHVALVLIFLNLLPYSKHFHVITGIPNVFLQDLNPPGRLLPIEDIEGKAEREETLGIRRISQFSWKSNLDFYTCTECGRCTDHCPASNTGKKLSPKHLTVDLRNFLYKHDAALVAAKASGNGSAVGNGEDNPPEHAKDLIDGVIDPDVLWACTTCRACEQECPVFITYVDKIVDMRRYLVQERGEFPNQLQTAFRGMETSGTPYNLPAEDRMNWAQGLDVPLMSDNPDVDVLLWVGCAAAFDDRVKKVARATVRLLQIAGVKFACLGTEEQCTGDPARRAGNEFLFQMMARTNIEILDNYNVKRIITICPHCYNTLAHEYPDFGGNYEVAHHADFLVDLIRQGRLRPNGRVDTTVTLHDSCYLGRYNDIYDSPRDALRSIPGLKLMEPAKTRDRAMCCSAGGGQMWKEEEPGDDKISFARTNQLVETGAKVIASACPFCMRMFTDGLNLQDIEGVEQMDIAELLLKSAEASANPAETK